MVLRCNDERVDHDTRLAYRWAKGEPISAGEGLPDMQILKPLDWYAVSDHAEYLGVLPLMNDTDSPLSELPLAKQVFGGDTEEAFAAYQEISHQIYDQPPHPDPELYSTELRENLWTRSSRSRTGTMNPVNSRPLPAMNGPQHRTGETFTGSFCSATPSICPICR